MASTPRNFATKTARTQRAHERFLLEALTLDDAALWRVEELIGVELFRKMTPAKQREWLDDLNGQVARRAGPR